MRASVLWLSVLILAIFGSASRAWATVVYDTSVGGLYNSVGPVEASPQFIGDRFTVSASGTLEAISLPLANAFAFAGPVANGTLRLLADAGGEVGSQLFSARVSATDVVFSNTELPRFTVVLASTEAPVFLSAGTHYWLTLSQDNGSGGLVFFSNVNLASDGTVFFGGNPVPMYGQGLQAMVVTVSISQIPEPSTLLSMLVGLVFVRFFVSSLGQRNRLRSLRS